jgi:hypothetical protein
MEADLPAILAIYYDLIATSNAVNTDAPVNLEDRRDRFAKRRAADFCVKSLWRRQVGTLDAVVGPSAPFAHCGRTPRSMATAFWLHSCSASDAGKRKPMSRLRECTPD